MNLGTFIRANRPQWHRLETMLGALEAKGPSAQTRPFLQELVALYRTVTGDLAYAQTHYRGTTLLYFLYQLVARAHSQIFRPQRLSLARVQRFFRFSVPAAAQRHRAAIVWSAIVLGTGFASGQAAVQIDERTATSFLPPEVVDSIYSGHLWTSAIFSVVPLPVASTAIFTNNITVALLAFIGGLTFGATTFLILFLNGFVFGVVAELCASHGLLGALLDFVAGHGLTEISAIVVAGGSGIALADALVHPGRLRRADALAERGRSALCLVLACVPTLLVAGLIETLISPSGWPEAVKIGLGLALAGLFWAYLFSVPRGIAAANPSQIRRATSGPS